MSGFEHVDVVSGSAEFVGGRKSGKACSKNNHARGRCRFLQSLNRGRSANVAQPESAGSAD
jgi:hypothetical protein